MGGLITPATTSTPVGAVAWAVWLVFCLAYVGMFVWAIAFPSWLSLGHLLLVVALPHLQRRWYPAFAAAAAAFAAPVYAVEFVYAVLDSPLQKQVCCCVSGVSEWSE